MRELTEFILLDEIVELELVLLVLLVAPADSPLAESETRIKALLRLH